MERPRRTIDFPFESQNKLQTWEQLVQEIERLNQCLISLKAQMGLNYNPMPLFRGHASHEWKLLSTLDRAIQSNEFSVIEYLEIAKAISKKVHHAFPHIPALEDITGDVYFETLGASPERAQYLSFMTYLRHHGYPSPLLDWSESLDIAAYFAFRERPQSQEVSIYIFVEYLNHGKMLNPLKPHIQSIGHDLKSHLRHANQLSHYSVCTFYRDNAQYFAPGEEALRLNTRAQDITIKYDLPASERPKVLAMLQKKGITTSQIMGKSEDNLIHDLIYEYFPSSV